MKNISISELEESLPIIKNVLSKIGKERKFFISEKQINDKDFYFIGVFNDKKERKIYNVYADNKDGKVLELLTQKKDVTEINITLDETETEPKTNVEEQNDDELDTIKQ